MTTEELEQRISDLDSIIKRLGKDQLLDVLGFIKSLEHAIQDVETTATAHLAIMYVATHTELKHQRQKETALKEQLCQDPQDLAMKRWTTPL